MDLAVDIESTMNQAKHDRDYIQYEYGTPLQGRGGE